MASDPFTPQEIAKAFKDANGKCECCGKALTEKNQGRDSGRGSWEAHHSGTRVAPVILCTESPESCHLRCGHDGDFKNPGITPRAHRK